MANLYKATFAVWDSVRGYCHPYILLCARASGTDKNGSESNFISHICSRFELVSLVELVARHAWLLLRTCSAEEKKVDNRVQHNLPQFHATSTRWLNFNTWAMCNHFQKVLISLLCLVLPNKYLKDIVHMVQKWRLLGNTFYFPQILCGQRREEKRKEGKRVNQNTSHNVVQDYTAAVDADLFSSQKAVGVRATQSIWAAQQTEQLLGILLRFGPGSEAEDWGGSRMGCLSWILCHSAGESSKGITRQKCSSWKTFYLPLKFRRKKWL